MRPDRPLSDIEKLVHRFDELQLKFEMLATPRGSEANRTVEELRKLVQNIQSQLDNYIATGTYNRAQLDQKFADLSAAKANTVHTHAASDITSGGTTAGGITVGGTFAATGVATLNAGINSTDVRNRTLATNYAAVYADGTGRLGISPSTLSKKSLLAKYVVDLTKWRSLSSWRYTYHDDPEKREMVSFLADLLGDFPEFQLRGDDGTLQGIRAEALIFGLHSAFVQYADATDARLKKLETALLTIRL